LEITGTRGGEIFTRASSASSLGWALAINGE
jgi:hypothetical protein